MIQSTRILRFCSVVGLLILASPTRVFAEPPETPPREIPSHDELSREQRRELLSLIEAGQKAYDAGNFQTALEAFEQAFAIFAHPDLTYRIATCHERLGNARAAIDAYSEFLRRVPEAKERGRVEKTIAALREEVAQSRLGRLRIVTDPAGAKVWIDGHRDAHAGTTPIELSVAVGSHQLRIVRDGHHPIVDTVKAPAGQSTVLHFSLRPLASSPSSSTSSSTDSPDSSLQSAHGAESWLGPVILGGVGLAAGITGVYGYAQFSSARDQIEVWDKRKARDEPRPSGYDSTFDDMQTYETVTWTAGLIGAAGLSAAAIWWWVQDDSTGASLSDEQRTRVEFAPSIHASDANWQVSLTGRF
jgi:tetratricopeptide (TPR) repeat protein